MARASADIDRLLAELNALKEQVAALKGETPPRGVMHDAATVIEAIDDAMRCVRGSVRDHPLLSILGAFALGLSVARITRL